MSRIGKEPVTIPEGVTVKIVGNEISVSGPKGDLSHTLMDGVYARQSDNEITVSVEKNELRKFWGLTRSLLFNMVEGVTQGYEKKLVVQGVGYNAKGQGQKITLNLGYSHPIEHVLPEGITGVVDKDPKGHDMITIQGADKQLVGEHAAKIRAYRTPEPYKGKGVRYLGEYVKIKPGKTAVKATAA